MASQFRYSGIIASALLGLMLVSCGSDSGNPVAPTPPGNVPAPVFIQRIDISGPDSIAPGQSAQLTATGVRSDGTSENVSASASWSSSTSRVIQVAIGGQATAVGTGEATVQARYQNRSGSRTVLVMPAGTYKVSGRITEGTLNLQGVSLRVVRGTGEGQTATSDFSGRFAFYGLAGDVRIQASKAGYIDVFRELSVGSSMTDDFVLAPARERKNLAGNYSLTVSAPSCAGSAPFPNELRSRTYVATVTQSAQALNVTLSGAEFVVSGDRGNDFSGSIDPLETVVFNIGDSYYYYYFSQNSFDVIERLDDSSSFTFAGFVVATVRGSEIAGTLSGSFIVLRGTRPPFTALTSTCHSNSHTFVMRPR